jgi:hypothetical protein
MKAVCISNQKHQGEVPWRLGPIPTNYSIEPGKEYVVYGICVKKALQFLLILDDVRDYPLLIPRALFGNIVGSVPPGFYYSEFFDESGSIEQWALSGRCFDDPYFYDSLTDRDSIAVEQWREFKESVDSWISLNA